MRVIQISYPLLENNFPESIIAIGYFDGVHLGHQQVINQARVLAKQQNFPCGVMTFNPHPKEIISKVKIDKITPLQSKLKQLESLQIDIVYVVNSSNAFVSITPKEFIDNFLLKLNVKGVVVGFDFTFGYKGLGQAETLKKLSFNKFDVEIIDPFYENGSKVSSTRVRDFLIEGKVNDAKRFLGRNYSFNGKVIHGEKRGRILGFPTANLDLLEDFLDIKNGVYAVKIKYDNKSYPGIMNIGYVPTFNQDKKKTFYEVHLFDLNVDLYDQTLEVELIEYIREEKKFNSVEELIQQINKDVNYAKLIMFDTIS